jgi:hypothetical protein
MEDLNTFIFDELLPLKNVIENNKYSLTFMILIFVIFLFFIFILFFGACISFIMIKFLQITLDKMSFFYDYNKLSKKVLKKYGDCEINKMYLIRSSLSKYFFIMKLATMVQSIEHPSKDELPYHTMILIELKLENEKVKWVMLEKNNCITINDNFIITQGMKIEELKINTLEKKLYLKSLLEETRTRMGNEKFFNWHMYENNCQEFTKELMVTIGIYDDYYKSQIFADKILDLVSPTGFVYCGFNLLHILHNFFEKYIFEIDIFN